jgi:tetratricopeptide (TPR) repeat protein
MTSLLISLIVWMLSQGAPNRIAERNQLKAEAERAFRQRKYAVAAALYRRLAESALIPEPAVLFNQAHAFFALGDTAQARRQYARLARVGDKPMAAAALSQLGVLACQSRDSLAALAYFRQALRVLPTYETARYNYELVRKSMPPEAAKPPRPPRASPQPSPAQHHPPAPQPQAGRDVLPSEKRQDVLRKLSRYNLTAEKAQMLLDAMRAEEAQYIQQRRRSAPVEEREGMKQTW